MSDRRKELEERFNGSQVAAIEGLERSLKYCDEVGLRGIVCSYGMIHVTTADDEAESTDGLVYIDSGMMIDNEIQIHD